MTKQLKLTAREKRVKAKFGAGALRQSPVLTQPPKLLPTLKKVS